jgi:hypothetical protein
MSPTIAITNEDKENPTKKRKEKTEKFLRVDVILM